MFYLDVPIWTYCYDPIKETYLKPVGLYNDPFRLAPHKIVFCETLEKGMQPSRKKIFSINKTNNSNKQCRYTPFPARRHKKLAQIQCIWKPPSDLVS
jgi:hypothetical protein